MKTKFIPGKTKIQYAGVTYDHREIAAMIKSIKTGWFGVGKKAREFEERFSKFMNLKETVIVNSGSSANLLAVTALDFKKGSEIIIPACTFPTLFNPILQNSLIPVVVDVELGTLNIDPNLIEQAITSKTKAIAVLHNLGNPCQMDKISKIARKYKLKIIEDNCDALGAKFKNKLTGTFSDISTYSFYVAHHMSMGEGGAVCSNDSNLINKIRSLRDWGRACTCKSCVVIKNRNARCPKRHNTKFWNLPEGYDNRYVYTNIGYNLKPLELQCAMGVEQLKKLPDFIKKRKENFRKLINFFKKYEKYFTLPEWYRQSNPSWFAFPLTVKENAGFSRKEIVDYLENKNIETRLIFSGNITKHPAYRNSAFKISGRLKNANKIMKNSFFLGVWPGLTEQQIDFIKKTVINFVGKQPHH